MGQEEVACHLVTIHNIAYQLTLMQSLRESIIEDKFVDFVINFMAKMYPTKDYPLWAINALGS
eukprot:Pgem_evm1s12517